MENDTKPQVRKELIAALTKSSLLQFVGHSDKHASELRHMFRTAKVESYKRGDHIIEEGQAGDCMYFLVRGKVKVSIGFKSICVLEEVGDVFGEMAAITGQLRSATVTALSEVTCLMTDTKFIRSLKHEQRMSFLYVLQQGLTKTLTSRLKTTSEELVELKDSLETAQAEIGELHQTNSKLVKENKLLKDQVSGRVYLAPRDTK